MKFALYKDKGGKEQVGVVSKDGGTIYSLKDMGHDFACMVDLIANYTDGLRDAIQDKLAKGAAGQPVADVTLDAPIPHPRHDITCIGQNYLAHALEGARFRGKEYVKPNHPTYFSKRVNRAVPPNGFISAHADITQQLDYENELAVIIGTRCDHVKREDVFKHIFGYTIVNDVSAREIQHNHVQFTFGKGLDDFAPMGPWIVTRDEFQDPPHLNLKTRVNGELRQDSNTNDFIFDIPYLISELSGGIVLEPGDILITGTPAGVGLGYQPPKFLKPGDVVECEIEGIGVLRNTVK